MIVIEVALDMSRCTDCDLLCALGNASGRLIQGAREDHDIEQNDRDDTTGDRDSLPPWAGGLSGRVPGGGLSYGSLSYPLIVDSGSRWYDDHWDLGSTLFLLT